MITFFLMDDDVALRRMLSAMIEDYDLGVNIGEASDGSGMETSIVRLKPDILLLDMLMPEQDGIETIRRLRSLGFTGKIVMLSQVEHPDLVSEAYDQGVEFYIKKPLNRIEVVAILRKVMERIQLEQSIQQIRRSLAWIGGGAITPMPERRISVADCARSHLSQLGVVGEAGSNDIVRIMEYLLGTQDIWQEGRFPALNDLYAAILPSGLDEEVVHKEKKALVQRIRRTVIQALRNVSSLGLADYGHPVFETYATTYFDFADVRQKMRELEGESNVSKVRLNLKKFLFALYLDVKKEIKVVSK
ncbi:response regulator [Brevibacillus daliensis]|uniref:response regulator n=1 Tax=Brevibacillus daliensis TaxID=2892995 RepID=UPI001E43EE30|nr:response regulator [Brevibacillus daliensis]